MEGAKLPALNAGANECGHQGFKSAAVRGSKWLQAMFCLHFSLSRGFACACCYGCALVVLVVAAAAVGGVVDVVVVVAAAVVVVVILLPFVPLLNDQ